MHNRLNPSFDTNHRRAVILTICLSLIAGAKGWSQSNAFSFASQCEATEWVVKFANKPVMVYAFDPQKPKPYVKALHTVKGYGVLRDSPADHLHHHALMYGIRVNGVNFWEETSGCGIQRVVDTRPPESTRTADNLPCVRIVQQLQWLAPEDAFLPKTNAPALLIERRTLTLAIDPRKSETLLVWHSSFEVGTKSNQVSLAGANYHGLGMRFLKELDPVATHLSPQGVVNLANNRQDASIHPWEAVVFKSAESPASIALGGSTRNAGGYPHFFAMASPFAYLSATQGLDRNPLLYKAGDRFDLTYFIVLYPENKTADELAARFRELDGPAAKPLDH